MGFDLVKKEKKNHVFLVSFLHMVVSFYFITFNMTPSICV